MGSDKSHPAVRPDDKRVSVDTHVVRAFEDLINGDLTQDEEAAFAKQISSGQARLTNKALIYLRDTYGDKLQEYFEALELRVAMGWLRPPAAQMKAINSLEQRMGWRDINNGRLSRKIVKKKIDGERFSLEVAVKERPEPVEAEVVSETET